MGTNIKGKVVDLKVRDKGQEHTMNLYFLLKSDRHGASDLVLSRVNPIWGNHLRPLLSFEMVTFV